VINGSDCAVNFKKNKTRGKSEMTGNFMFIHGKQYVETGSNTNSPEPGCLLTIWQTPG